jgi:hypothetical protein
MSSPQSHEFVFSITWSIVRSWVDLFYNRQWVEMGYLGGQVYSCRLGWGMVYFSDHSPFLRFSSICAWTHGTNRASIAPNLTAACVKIRCSPTRLICTQWPVPAIFKSSLLASENRACLNPDNDDPRSDTDSSGLPTPTTRSPTWTRLAET